MMPISPGDELSFAAGIIAMAATEVIVAAQFDRVSGRRRPVW
jgi:hypothetical protein